MLEGVDEAPRWPRLIGRFFDELHEVSLKWLTPRAQGLGTALAPFYQQARQRDSGRGSIAGAGRVERPPAVATRTASMGDGTTLRIGQGVFHAEFGEGVVVTLEGRSADARAQIHFGRHGTKWLVLAAANFAPS